MSESETKAMFEKLRDWLNEECGRKVVDLVTDVFDDEAIHLDLGFFDTHIYDYVWESYGDFLFGHEHMSSSGKNGYHIKSVFETVESYLNDGGKIRMPVESAFWKLLSLKGVSSLAELELRLAAIGEN